MSLAISCITSLRSLAGECPQILALWACPTDAVPLNLGYFVAKKILVHDDYSTDITDLEASQLVGQKPRENNKTVFFYRDSSSADKLNFCLSYNGHFIGRIISFVSASALFLFGKVPLLCLAN